MCFQSVLCWAKKCSHKNAKDYPAERRNVFNGRVLFASRQMLQKYSAVYVTSSTWKIVDRKIVDAIHGPARMSLTHPKRATRLMTLFFIVDIECRFKST